jgi:hypothetical protein
MHDPAAAGFSALWLPLEAAFHLFSKLSNLGGPIRSGFR